MEALTAAEKAAAWVVVVWAAWAMVRPVAVARVEALLAWVMEAWWVERWAEAGQAAAAFPVQAVHNRAFRQACTCGVVTAWSPLSAKARLG